MVNLFHQQLPAICPWWFSLRWDFIINGSVISIITGGTIWMSLLITIFTQNWLEVRRGSEKLLTRLVNGSLLQILGTKWYKNGNTSSKIRCLTRLLIEIKWKLAIWFSLMVNHMMNSKTHSSKLHIICGMIFRITNSRREDPLTIWLS